MMDFASDNLLSLMVFSPLVGAALVAVLPNDEENAIRWVALLTSSSRPRCWAPSSRSI